VDAAGAPTLLNCLMYKLSYFRFGELQVGGPVYKLVYSLCVCFIISYKYRTTVSVFKIM